MDCNAFAVHKQLNRRLVKSLFEGFRPSSTKNAEQEVTDNV